MEKETSCMNSRVILNYLKAHNIDCSCILENLDPEIDGLEDPESFLSNPDNWISCRVISELYSRAKLALDDEMAAYKMGRYASENIEMGYVQKIVVRSFWSFRKSIKNVQKLNDRWNRSKRVEVVALKQNEAVLRLFWEPGMTVTKDICLYNRGAYTFMPLVWGGNPASLIEKCCYFDGAPYCEYHLKWPMKNRLHEIASRIFTSKAVLMDTIKEMERDKRVVEEKSETLKKEIEERKQAEDALKESEAKYRSMMEALKDPSYICSQDFRIEYMNPAMIERTGSDAVGELCFKVINGLDEKCPWCNYNKKQQGEHFIEEIVSPMDGRSYSVSHSPIHHIDGSIAKLAIYRDITEIKKLEQQLQQSTKLESIGRLAGGIAHDFNNILFPIMAHSELVMGQLPHDSPWRSNLEQIFTASERARDLVQQILTFARKQEDIKIPIKVSTILKEVVKLLRSTIPSTVSIEYRINAKKDIVLSDPAHLNQIIMNLCTNAAHTMEDTGGTLELTLTSENYDSGSDPEIPGLEPGCYVKLSVKDTGCGIEPRFIDKIFEPYFTTKEVGKGTGMGLSIVHGIVKSHGGEILVESERGRGTTFTVYLPVFETDVPRPEEISQSISTGTERILFVDDEKMIVEMIPPMLERLGYKVVAKNNSIETLETFKKNPRKFDIVITDQTMPGLTGKNLAREIKAVRNDIPVILCTGYSEQVNENNISELGIDALAMKPILIKEIAVVIRDLLDKEQRHISP